MPISSWDVHEYCALLECNEGQQLRILDGHEQYKERFASLYHERYKSFLERLFVAQPGIYVMGDRRQAISETAREHKKLMRQITSLEEEFFASFTEMLSEEQRIILRSIELQRERVRYLSEISRYIGTEYNNPSVLVELRPIVEQATLTDAEKKLLTPLLARYEEKLTSRLRSLFETSIDIFGDYFVFLDELGYSPETRADRVLHPGNEQAARIEAWRNASHKVMKQASRVSELHWETFTNLMDMLPLPARLGLRHQFFSASYPELANSDIERLIYDSVTVDNVPAEMRQRLLDLGEALLAEKQQWIQETVSATEDWRRNADLFTVGSAAWEEYRKVVSEAVSNLDQVDTRARDQIRGLLDSDEEYQTLLSNSSWKSSEEQTKSSDVRLRYRVSNDSWYAKPELQPHRPVIPPAIDESFVEYCLHLFDNNMHSAAKQEYAEYLASYKLVENDYLKLLMEWNEIEVHLRHSMERPTSPNGSQIDNLCRMHFAILDVLAILDDQFLESLQNPSSDDENQLGDLKLLLAMRQLKRYNDRGFGGPLFDYNQEWTIDLGALLAESKIDITPEFKLILGEYYREALSLASTRQEAWDRWRKAYLEMKANDKAAWMILRLRRAGEEVLEAMRTIYRERASLKIQLAETTRDLRNIEIERSLQNQAYLIRIMTLVESNTGESFVSAYKQKGFPSIYGGWNTKHEAVYTAVSRREVGLVSQVIKEALLIEYSSRVEQIRSLALTICRQRLKSLTYVEGLVGFEALRQYELEQLIRQISLRWIEFELDETAAWLSRGLREY